MRNRKRFRTVAGENSSIIRYDAAEADQTQYDYEVFKTAVLYPCHIFPISRIRTEGGTLTMKDFTFSYASEPLSNDQVYPQFSHSWSYFNQNVTVKIFILPQNYVLQIYRYLPDGYFNMDPTDFSISDYVPYSQGGALIQATTLPWDDTAESYMLYNAVSAVSSRDPIKLRGPYTLNEGDLIIATIQLMPSSPGYEVDQTPNLINVPQIAPDADLMPPYVLNCKAAWNYKISYN